MSSHLLVHSQARLPAWSATLESISGYTPESLTECVNDVLRVYRAADAHTLQVQ